MDALRGYRTVIVSTVMFAVMLLAIYKPGADLPDEETVGGAVDNVMAAVASTWYVASLIVRAITKTAMFQQR